MIVLVFTLLSYSLISCIRHDDGKVINEIVMTPGMMIKATNASGTIVILAKKTFERVYKWGDKEVDVKLAKRDSRWNGSLGIYSPGGNDIVHTVVEEGQQHFYSQIEAIDWLNWQDKDLHYVYSSDGLVVGWYARKEESSHSTALSVQVWQFYIQGKKPSRLPGAHDDLIAVKNNGSGEDAIKSGYFVSSIPKTIGNRLYSGKAIDIMSEKGINPENVENCIINGKFEKQGDYTYYYDFADYKFLWVSLNSVGKVVLVGN